jgi:hypothetical protein
MAFVLAAERVEAETLSVRKKTCCPQQMTEPFLHILVALK